MMEIMLSSDMNELPEMLARMMPKMVRFVESVIVQTMENSDEIVEMMNLIENAFQTQILPMVDDLEKFDLDMFMEEISKVSY